MDYDFRAGRQGLEAAQGLPLRLQPLHGGLHGAQAQRAEAARSVVAVKLTQNAGTNAYVDPAKFERAVGKSSVTNFELQIDSEGFLAFVETLKTDRSKASASAPRVARSRSGQQRRSRKRPRRSGAPAAAAPCGPSGRACCRPRGPRSTSGARALRRPCPCSAAGSSRARAAALSECARLSLDSTGWRGGAATRPSWRSGPCTSGTCTPCSRRCWWAWLPGSAPAGRPAPGSCGSGCRLCRRSSPDDASAARGALLEDVVVLQPVRPQGLLPHEDEDLHPPGVAELEGLDVVEVHGAVRRQAREVHPRVGQSGLPAWGARSSAAGQLGVEEGARAFDRWCLLSPSTPRQWARTRHMKQWRSSF